MTLARLPVLTVLVATILCAGASAENRGSDDPPGGYSARFHERDFNVVLGTVRSCRRTGRNTVVYEVTPLGDMRGKVKPGAAVTVSGGDANTFSHTDLNIPHFADGEIAAFSVRGAGGPTQLKYCGSDVLPIGIDTETPIQGADVGDVIAALRELGRALAAPDGAGPSRERVDQLLHERNPYLWAFGAWRLSKDASLDDLQRLKSLFSQPGLAPARALWVDNLFDTMTGPAAADRPSREEQHNLLRRYMENYVRELGQLAPTTRHE